MKTKREQLDVALTELRQLGKQIEAKGWDNATAQEAQSVISLSNQVNLLCADIQAAKAMSAEGIQSDSPLAKALANGAFDGGATASAPLHVAKSSLSAIEAKSWAEASAEVVKTKAGAIGVKALTSGSFDIPTMVRAEPIALPTSPDRIIDLLVDRERLESNEFSFLRQTVRTNNAAPVADGGTKPTSVFTVAPVEDRARVIAHLSEPIPERYFEDYRNLIRFLESEMFNGVADALEEQIVAGDGTGENMTGILELSGTTPVAFDTNYWTTMRKARTALQVKKERPTAWAIHPADAEAIDLLADLDGNFLVNAGMDNIFGGLPRVVSTSIPEGTAVLADWRQVRLFVRSEMRLDADRSGPDLFDKNLVKLRCEGRFGAAVLRPQAIAVVELTEAA